MESKLIAILSMPRNGTNYLCDLIRKFQEVDSLYEIYHNKSSYINNLSLANKVIRDINQKYQLKIEKQSDRQLIDFINRHPQAILNLLAKHSNKKYVSFKIFPNHLSSENLKQVIIRDRNIKKIIVKRNLLDVYFSSQIAQLTKRWDRKDTSDLKLDFNPGSFLKCLESYRSYYNLIETELKNSQQEVLILNYEKIHNFNTNQEKFIFLFNFFRSVGIQLDQSNLFNYSAEELNKNIRKKQDKRSDRLEKVTNPQLLLNTLKQNQLESLLV